MGERFWVTLEVGGELTEAQHQELLELMDTEGPDDEPEINDESGHLYAQFPEVNYAEMDEIEEFFQKHKLSYDKTVDGKSGFDTAIYWWRPGMNEKGVCLASTEGGSLIRISDVWDALKAGDGNPMLAGPRVEELLTKAEPPELPAYRIVELHVKCEDGTMLGPFTTREDAENDADLIHGIVVVTAAE